MLESNLKQNIPLAPLTTFKIGGPASFYIEVKVREDLIESINWAKKNNYDYFIIGGGSNILISDSGFKGLIIRLINDEIYIKGERLECGAAARLPRVVRVAIGDSLTGLEWAISIPGTIGGAIRGNAGAYGEEICKSVETLEIYSTKNLKFYKVSRNDCEFNYRESIFKNQENLIIWQVSLRLKKGNINEIDNLVEKYLNARERTQPKLPNAGSVFKNISFEEIRNNNIKLAEKAMAEGVVINNYVPAGWLIDLLDIKGKTIGGAKISLEHANFIVNTGKASAENVITLISYIKQQVRDLLKIQLKEEIQYLGF